MKKVYSINTTSGKRFAIGIFDNGEMLASGSPKYYKTEKAAKKKLSLF